jgi:hypothetical protein
VTEEELVGEVSGSQIEPLVDVVSRTAAVAPSPHFYT